MASKPALLIPFLFYTFTLSVQAQSINKSIILHDGYENSRLVRTHTVVHYYSSSKRLIAGYVTVDKVEEYANRDKFSTVTTLVRQDTILHFHGIMDKGKKNGTFLDFPRDNIFYVHAYENDKQEGDFIGYYYNGQVYCKGTYNKGILAGEYRQYYANGKLSLYKFFSDGVTNLIYQEYYYQNGQVESKGSTYNEKKVNEWSYYNYHGELLRTEYYNKGRLLRTKKQHAM